MALCLHIEHENRTEIDSIWTYEMQRPNLYLDLSPGLFKLGKTLFYLNYVILGSTDVFILGKLGTGETA